MSCDNQLSHRLSAPHVIAKPRIEAEFGKNAGQYDALAKVQRTIADHLIDSMIIPLKDKLKDSKKLRILDAGCGTGYLASRLQASLQPLLQQTSLQMHQGIDIGQLEITAFDLSKEMLEVAMAKGCYDRSLQGDIEMLSMMRDSLVDPIVDPITPYDFVMSSLAVQWCHHFETALTALQSIANVAQKYVGREDEAHQRPNVYITTLLKGTLQELEKAFERVDNETHILRFETKSDVVSIVERLGGRIEVYEEIMTFDSLRALFQSLKGIGATNVPNRRKGLLGKNDYQKLDEYFKSLGRYQLTYVVAEITLPGTYQRE